MRIVAGIHLMAIAGEKKAPEIIAATGLLPRRGAGARRASGREKAAG